MKILYLHIGMPKTGTSSIQDTLFANRENLRKYGIYYPDILPQNHSWSFGSVILKGNETNEYLLHKGINGKRQKRAYIRSLKKQWKKEIRTCKQKSFIVSSENIYMDIKTGKDSDAYLAHRFFSRYFKQIRIIVYVRHPFAYLSSIIQQILKNQYKPLEEITKKIASFDLYSNQLERFIRFFGKENIIVRPFEPQRFHQNSLVSDFLYAIDPSQDFSFIEEIKINESLSRYNCLFLSEFNKIFPRGKTPSARAMENDYVVMNRILARVKTEGDVKFALSIEADEALTDKMNREIDYINVFFKDEFQFKHIDIDVQKREHQKITELPQAYFDALIVQYQEKHEELKQAIISVLGMDTPEDFVNQALDDDTAGRTSGMTMRGYIDLINQYNAKLEVLLKYIESRQISTQEKHIIY